MRPILFIVLSIFVAEGYANPYFDAAVALDQINYELVEELMLPLARQGKVRHMPKNISACLIGSRFIKSIGWTQKTS